MAAAHDMFSIHMERNLKRTVLQQFFSQMNGINHRFLVFRV